MQIANVEPNLITYNALIHACAQVGATDAAFQVRAPRRTPLSSAPSPAALVSSRETALVGPSSHASACRLLHAQVWHQLRASGRTPPNVRAASAHSPASAHTRAALGTLPSAHSPASAHVPPLHARAALRTLVSLRTRPAPRATSARARRAHRPRHRPRPQPSPLLALSHRRFSPSASLATHLAPSRSISPHLAPGRSGRSPSSSALAARPRLSTPPSASSTR